MNQRSSLSSPVVVSPPQAAPAVEPSAQTHRVASDHQADSACWSLPAPHRLECEVQHHLKSHPALKFSSLHVHQCPGGICIEGMLESNEDEVDLCAVVREVEGVTNVINRVVATHPIDKRAK